MMKFTILSVFCLSLISCSPKYLTGDINDSIQKICLNLDGNGRLTVSGHKYVFSAETLFDEEEHKWVMGMNFPMHGQEIVELDLSEESEGFTEKVQEKVLKEKAGINPEDLNLFMKRWASFLKEVINSQKHKKNLSEQFIWRSDRKSISASSTIDEQRKIEAKFYNIDGKYFSKMDFILIPQNKEKEIKIELIVRKCLDK